MPEIANNPDRIYTVAELNRLVNGLVASQVGGVWVRGEISGLTRQASGHIYFSLKDAESVISVALFKGNAVRLTVELKEGKQMLVYGEPGIYLPRGSFQMVAKFVLEEGIGKLQQEFERLKKQLTEEGLFAKENKIELPRLPQTVAFVTSPTGAVWQDFSRILRRRDWRGRVILFPCRVQGKESVEEIVAQIKAADEWNGVELIVVGRGGGSLEDLWSFNTQEVVRAVAACRRPIISAVGHETDVTLCDFAADMRAETPSAAAELIAGHFNDARAEVENFAGRFKRALAGVMEGLRRHVQNLGARLAGRAPRVVLDRAYQRLDEMENRLKRGSARRVERAKEMLATAAARLKGLDPAATLKRGYVMVKDKEGRILPKAAPLVSGMPITLAFGDGHRTAKVE